jgi:hypothetical protein
VEKSTSLCLRDNKRGTELVGTSAKVRNPAKESYPYRALKTNGLVKEGHKTEKRKEGKSRMAPAYRKRLL